MFLIDVSTQTENADSIPFSVIKSTLEVDLQHISSLQVADDSKQDSANALENVAERLKFYQFVKENVEKNGACKLEHNDMHLFSRDMRNNKFWHDLQFFVSDLTDAKIQITNNLPNFMANCEICPTGSFFYIYNKNRFQNENFLAEKKKQMKYAQKLKHLDEEFAPVSLPKEFTKSKSSFYRRILSEENLPAICRFCKENFNAQIHECKFNNNVVKKCGIIRQNLEACPSLITTKNSVTHHNQHSFHGYTTEMETQEFVKVLPKGAVQMKCQQQEHQFYIPDTKKEDQHLLKFLENNKKARTISIRVQSNNLQNFKKTVVHILQNLKCQLDIGGLAQCYHKVYRKIVYL